MPKLNSLILDHGPLVAGIGLFLVYSLRALIFAGGAQLWTRVAAWPKHRYVVLPGELRTDALRDLRRGVLVLALDSTWFALLIAAGLFTPERHSTALAALAAVAALFAWFEIYFYFSHRLLHHPRLYWMHRFHHEGRGTNPWTSLAFSMPERLVLQVGAYIPLSVLSHYVPVSLDGVGLYFLLNYALNVYGHMNVELAPGWFRRTFLFDWWNTSVSHSLHHLRYKGHYGLFTRFLDRALGTDFPDYPEVFDQVIAGRGYRGIAPPASSVEAKAGKCRFSFRAPPAAARAMR